MLTYCNMILIYKLPTKTTYIHEMIAITIGAKIKATTNSLIIEIIPFFEVLTPAMTETGIHTKDKIINRHINKFHDETNVDTDVLGFIRQLIKVAKTASEIQQNTDISKPCQNFPC